MKKMMKMVLGTWVVFRSICVGGCLVLGAGTTFAAEGVPYRAWNEATRQMETRMCTDYTAVTAETEAFENGKWYVVTGAVSRGTITVNVAAHLILCDGATLTATGGIRVNEGNALSVYAQSEGGGMGKLIATGAGECAGIGGGNNGAGGVITINGGAVTATGGGEGAGIGGGAFGGSGTIAINGGVVTAAGTNGAAGIGGIGGEITIAGGVVTATGSANAAGIGSGNGRDCGTVKISGGVVTATGGSGGAGIGGGYGGIGGGGGGTIAITGGTVTATGGGEAADIGGGTNSAGGEVTINGGTVTAMGADPGAGIGGGNTFYLGTVKFGAVFNVVTGETAAVTAPIAQDDYENNHSAKYVHIEMPPAAPAPVAPAISAKSAKFAVDLRTAVGLDAGEVTVSNVTYSATAWGAAGEATVTLGWTNETTGAVGELATGLTGEGVTNAMLPKKDGDYRLTHSTDGLKSFVKFTVSGYPLGSEGNPWEIGAGDDAASMKAWKDGNTVFFDPARGVATKAGLATVTNAMGGAPFTAKLIAADGSVTNDLVMVLGASGATYETLADALAADETSYTLLDTEGAYVEFNAMGGVHTNGLEVLTNFFVSAYTLPEAPVRTDYTFLGWYDGWTNGAAVVTNGQALLRYTPHTLYAKWKSTKLPPSPTPGEPIIKTDGAGTIQRPTNSVPGELILPETDTGAPDGTPLTKIDAKAFAALANITKVALPLYVKEIGARAFYNDRNLGEVTFVQPRDFATLAKVPLVIGDYAFMGSEIESVTIPSTTTSIGAAAFANCANLTNVTILGALTISGQYPFRDCGTAKGGVTITLSPRAAQDADFILNLTNGCNNAVINPKYAGEVAATDIRVDSPETGKVEIYFTYSADDIDINVDTVTAVTAASLGETGVSAKAPMIPLEVRANGSNSYTAVFEKPVGASGFFRITVNIEK